MLSTIRERYRQERITRKQCLIALHALLGTWAAAWAQMVAWEITGGYSIERIRSGDADAF